MKLMTVLSLDERWPAGAVLNGQDFAEKFEADFERALEAACKLVGVRRAELPPHLQRCYDAVAAYWQQHHYGPTMRELGALINRSLEPTTQAVRRLIALGMLEQAPSFEGDGHIAAPRSLRPTVR